jgi:hypothetical protein
MYSTPVDLSFPFLRSAVEASLDTKKDQVDQNSTRRLIIYVGTLPDSDKFLCIAQELSKIYVEEVARSFQHDVVIMPKKLI